MKKLIPPTSYLTLFGLLFTGLLFYSTKQKINLDASAPSVEFVAEALSAPPPTCQVPDWPYTTYITATSATFNWGSVYGALNYSVQYRMLGGSWWYVPGGPFNYNTVTLYGLQPGTTYEWRVRANCSNGEYSDWTYPVQFTTIGYTYCETPEWTYTTNITQTSATANWTEVPAAINYTVQWRLQGGYWMTLGTVNTNWASLTGLQPGTTYEWRVRSNCYGNYSAWTYSEYFTTLGAPCSPPAWLYTLEITQTSAKLKWDPVWGAPAYIVEYRPVGGGYWTQIGPVYGTWTIVYGLQPNTTYEWHVKADCGYGQWGSWSYIATFTTLGAPPCSPPAWLYTTEITQNSAKLKWDEVWGAPAYIVEYRPVGGGYWTQVGPISGTWTVVYGLQPNTTYEWHVKADCGYGQWGYWSYIATFTTLGAPPCSPPAWLYTLDITQNSAKLKWDEVWGAAGYIVEYRPVGGGYWTQVGPINGTWTVVYNLQPNTTYEWHVKADCGYGQWGYWSYTATFTTLGAPACSPPSWLYTSEITQYSAKLKWAEVWGAQSYIVEYRPLGSGGYWTQVGPLSGTWTVVSGLQPGTTYEWHVKASCSYGSWSYWSPTTTFTTLGYYCTAPSWLYTNDITSTSATFHWDAVPGAVGYSVQYRALPNGTWIDVWFTPSSNNWVNVTGLYPNTTYEWRVRTDCNNYSWSNWSYSQTFTTGGGLGCGTPSNPYTTDITENSAVLHWSAVSGAQDYGVEYRKVNTPNWIQVPGWNPNTYVNISNLMPNTAYEWHVRANCGNGNYSSWSYTVTFTTLGSSSCEIPNYLYTINITPNSASLNWSAVPGAIGYEVEVKLETQQWSEVNPVPYPASPAIVSLQPNTAYNWRVRAVCGVDNFSPWSWPLSFSTPPGPPCAVPGNPFTSAITDTSAQFNWNAVPGAMHYSVQYRILPNGSWSILPGNPFTDTFAVATNLIPNTSFEWRVSTNCDNNGNYSAWTAPVSFTTNGFGPNNDDCSTAMELPVNPGCDPVFASNVDATPSSPAPAGGCPSNNYKDVWFRFTMPDVNNPAVTIRTTAGSLTDAVMEVYTGTDCSILSYITCEDNNNNGNNSSMPVINLTGSPNVTIWVRVWGYDGSTGNFNICVFNYISVNYASNPDTGQQPFDGESFTDLEKTTPTNLTDEVVTPPEVQVMPNPARDILYVKLSGNESCTVTDMVMTDLSGQVITSRNYPEMDSRDFKEQVDVSGWTPGMYILLLRTSSGILSTKVSVVGD